MSTNESGAYVEAVEKLIQAGLALAEYMCPPGSVAYGCKMAYAVKTAVDAVRAAESAPSQEQS